MTGFGCVVSCNDPVLNIPDDMRSAFAFLFLMSVSAFVVASEIANVRSVAEALPAELAAGQHHTVLEPVKSDGYLNHYLIQSRFGTNSAVGQVELRVRINEIEALDELDKVSKTKVFVDAAAAAGVDTVKSIAGAFTDPKATFKSLPKGVGRLFKRTKTTVERGIRQANELASGQSPTDASAIAVRNAQISQAERNWARKVGVDPYSTNLVLRDAISSVALIDSAASFTVGLAVPGVASIGVDILAELADDIWTKAPSALADANRQRFAAADFDPGKVDAIVENVWYTPSSQTILASSIASLSEVENVASLALPIMSVQSYDEARFVTQIIAMLAWYHKTEKPLASVIDDPRLPHGTDTEDRHVALFPIDYLYATEQTMEAASRMKSASQAGTHLLWVTGSMSEDALSSLEEEGWTVRQNSMKELVDRLQLR